MADDHVAHFGRIEITGNPNTVVYRTHPWDYGRYRTAVLRLLTSLSNSPVGAIVLGAMSRRVIICPMQREFADNAVARPISGGPYIGYSPPLTTPENLRHGVMRGRPVPAEFGILGTARRNTRALGSGRGADAVVEFTPGMFVPGSPIALGIAGSFRPDTVLLHELVHALRITRGQFDTTTTHGVLADYDQNDEFHAILIANIYRSERGISPLRANHGIPFQPLQNPAGFYQQGHNKIMVMNLCREMQDFTRSIADIQCDFNPIREYYQEMGEI